MNTNITNVKTHETLTFLHTLITVVLSTDNIIFDESARGRQVFKKGHGNFVTTVDTAVESYLRQRLSELLPCAGFIGEESGYSANSEYNWVVDPIDGTTNFLFGYDFAVSVALKRYESTEVGVVYAPRTKTVYYARRGHGAYKRALNSPIDRPLEVGKDRGDGEGIIIFGLPYNRDRSGEMFRMAEQLYTQSSGLRILGPAALDICRVAEGKAKAYVEFDMKEWDYAAGKLILGEAGGDMYRTEDNLFISADAEYVGQLRKLLKK